MYKFSEKTPQPLDQCSDETLCQLVAGGWDFPGPAAKMLILQLGVFWKWAGIFPFVWNGK